MERILRPWGVMWKLVSTSKFWVKLIHVYPNERTSLQAHQHRSEIFIWFLGVSYVPAMTKHRLNENGWVLEISFGDVDEDDIIRYEDDYGRE